MDAGQLLKRALKKKKKKNGSRLCSSGDAGRTRRRLNGRLSLEKKKKRDFYVDCYLEGH